MKIAIIGLGNIAERVAKGIQYAKNAQLYAVASRDYQKANRFKEKYYAQKAYGSYIEMLQDPQVELVYICTPNFLHHEHIMLSLRYHKHVLCEKPLVSTMAQLEECFAYAKKQQCFLMEAEKTLFTPLNQKIKRLIEEGIIGNLRYIEAGYGADMEIDKLPEDSWLHRSQDGGSLFDVGVYPICYANYFADAKLSQIQLMNRSTQQGLDVMTQGMLGYDNGIMAYIRSSWDTNFYNRAVLYGDLGTVVTENFWKNTKATLCIGEEEKEIQVEMESDFTGEIEHALTCIEQGLLESPILGQDASIQIMKVLEEIHKDNCVHVEKSVK